MSQNLWTITTVIAALGAGVFGIILAKLHKVAKAQDETFQPAQLCLRCLQPQDSAAHRRFSWLFLPMIFYVGLTMAVVAHNTAAQMWLRQTMYAATLCACLTGFSETLLLLGRKGKAASVFGLAKWIFFILWTACMFISLFLQGWAL